MSATTYGHTLSLALCEVLRLLSSSLLLLLGQRGVPLQLQLHLSGCWVRDQPLDGRTLAWDNRLPGLLWHDGPLGKGVLADEVALRHS